MALSDAAPFAAAHWSLDEAGGTRADSVGSSGLLESTTVGSAVGQFGIAADFEAGETDRLTCADNAALSVGDIDFCLSFWIRPESFGGLNYIVAKGNTSAATGIAYGVSTNASHQLRLLVGDGAGNFADLAATGFGALTAGNWYLVVVKHDGANDVVGISVNGGAYQTLAYAHGSHADGQPLTVGALLADGTFGYDGLLDDLVFLKGYILDEAEVTELWAGGAGVAFANWAGSGMLAAYQQHRSRRVAV